MLLLLEFSTLDPKRQELQNRSSISAEVGTLVKVPDLPKLDTSKMSYNPANFAYWIGDEPWIPGYSVAYAVSFYDAQTGTESERSDWWGPESDPRSFTADSALLHTPTDPNGRATGRRIWRKFAGQPEKLIHEIPDNVTTKYQDDVR